MDDQRSLEQQLLGDMTYEDPRKAAQNTAGGVDPRLAGASAVLLDDMSGAAPAAPKPQSIYQELSDEQIAILQQQRAEKGQPPYTPEEIADLKAEFVERQRAAAMQQAMAEQAAAQQQASAMLLSEPEDYSRPEKIEPAKILPQVDASSLLEEPAPEPERKVTFNQEDLEAAKKQAAKRAAESLQEAPAKTEEDQKRARRELMELRRQQQEDLAQQGFMVSVVMTVLGVFAGVATLVYSMGAYANPQSVPAPFKLFDKFHMIAGVLLILLSITIVARVKQLKGFTSFMFVITGLTLVVPGIADLLSQKKGASGFGVTAAAYVIAIILCVVVMFTLSSSDKLKAYYAKSDVMYD